MKPAAPRDVRVNVYLGDLGPAVTDYCRARGIPLSRFVREALDHAMQRREGFDSIGRAHRALNVLDRAVRDARAAMGRSTLERQYNSKGT